MNVMASTVQKRKFCALLIMRIIFPIRLGGLFTVLSDLLFTCQGSGLVDCQRAGSNWCLGLGVGMGWTRYKLARSNTLLGRSGHDVHLKVYKRLWTILISGFLRFELCMSRHLVWMNVTSVMFLSILSLAWLDLSSAALVKDKWSPVERDTYHFFTSQ